VKNKEHARKKTMTREWTDTVWFSRLFMISRQETDRRYSLTSKARTRLGCRIRNQEVQLVAFPLQVTTPSKLLTRNRCH